MMNKKTQGTNTAIVHSGFKAPEGFSAFPTAIHHASTVLFKDVAAMRARSWLNKSTYTYGLHGTPTSFQLEAEIAQIEGGSYCVLAPSGLAAITLVSLSFLGTGDDVLIPDNAYGPNKELGAWLKQSFGISVRFYDPMIGAGIADLILPNTKLIWAEAPGSVSMEVADIPAICHAAHGKGVLVALDNTWSAGLAFKPFEHGVDISMQALTKYQSGGSDVLMGAVITRDQELNNRLLMTHMRLGLGVGMDDVYLVLRGLQSLKLRFEAHDLAARKLAAWLKTRPEIAKVLHPAWEDCPGHAIWQRDFTGAGGLFSVLFHEKFSEEQTDQFVNQLKLFKIGFSWGGSHSLCVPYRIETMRENWSEKGTLVRFNVGLEDVDDLIADIAQSLDQL
ncbi:cystathionine beta-lyase [Undibacterium fentianense]|uniref:Cystathionine beta-lyase n=1 Tax=Undibacterium fentianense TaxID=2828728 RepID=A0A941IDR0_9BURK|nr:cystathionine beta-lyase [Undibacterium fentianense]MBR7798647.1 cystathionine beta-lyase [Undibacterium fentianense]